MGVQLSSSPFASSPADIWAAAFDAVGERFGSAFARSETREQAQAYLRGLLSPIKRKNGWQLAEEAGEATPYAMQYLLQQRAEVLSHMEASLLPFNRESKGSTFPLSAVDRARWESDGLRDILREYVCEQLGDGRAVLVIDETGFVKKGLAAPECGSRQQRTTALRLGSFEAEQSCARRLGALVGHPAQHSCGSQAAQAGLCAGVCPHRNHVAGDASHHRRTLDGRAMF